MHNVCLSCEKEVKLQVVHSRRITMVRGEPIDHEDHYYLCPLCLAKAWDSSLPDPLLEAYQEFEKKFGVKIKPEI